MIPSDLPILSFQTGAELRSWLVQNHASSAGIWVRLYKKSSRKLSLSFLELLDEGLCFGWSESARQSYDDVSYLQKFTPRRTRGTHSPRNRSRVEELIRTGRMTRAGLDAL
jgi:uncharacterized protein YdeI (YjbR/CyaY-like superfamily)